MNRPLPPPVSWPPPPSGAVGSPTGGNSRPTFAPRREPHPTLPWQAGVGAVVVLAASLIGSKLALDALIDLDWPIALYVAVLVSAAYGPSLLWWRHASRRWGSGHPIGDVGARPRWSDLGWGPLVWLASIGMQIGVAAIVLITDVPLSNNTDGIGELSADRTYVIAIVIAAVVAAPLVEEIVFRGLVLRSFLSVMPAWFAVLLQGALFGAAHVDPVRGVGNVGLALVLTGVGVALGGAALLLRRIGPTIVAHAIFNGVVMILVLTGVSERLREENDPFASAGGEEIAVVDEPDVAEPHGGGDADRAGRR